MRPVTYWWTWRPEASTVAISCSTDDRVRIRLGGQQAQGYHGSPAGRRARGGTAAPALERVDVEELGAVERQAGQHAVEQRPLDGVGEARLARGQQQPPGEHHAARWRRTSRRTRGRAAARTASRTPRPRWREPSAPVRYVRSRPHVVPAPDDRVQQLRVVGLDRHVHGARSRGTAGAPRGRSRVGASRTGLVVLPVAGAEPALRPAAPCPRWSSWCRARAR